MKKKPRPVIEWLDELPELIWEIAINDCEYPRRIVSSMSDAIYGSCIWELTKMGISFYCAIYEDALYHEQNNIKI
jgi:hypothetical protein